MGIIFFYQKKVNNSLKELKKKKKSRSILPVYRTPYKETENKIQHTVILSMKDNKWEA